MAAGCYILHLHTVNHWHIGGAYNIDPANATNHFK